MERIGAAHSRRMRSGIAMPALVIGALVFTAALGEEHAPPKRRTAPDDLVGEEAQAVALYKRILPTVVTILASRTVPTPLGPRPQESLGSGVVISVDGLVLTAAHVIESADSIVIKDHEGEQHEATLVFSEASADIALLRFTDPPPRLKPATLGDSDRLAVGQLTYVAGSPFGLEHSFTVGHISGFHEFDRLYDGTILAEFIQTDAAINSGNSGGPVFNSRGEVIGIASRILTHTGGSEGLGFVIAINTAKQLLALEGRAWMGIEAIYLSREWLERLLNLDQDGGLLVQHVASGSPADKAGLRGGSAPAEILGQTLLLGGDLILEFNHQAACHSECLIREHDRIGQVDRIPVKYLRGGVVHETVVDVSATRRNYLADPTER